MSIEINENFPIPKNQSKQEKSQNQYINETELKSLIIRINNKTFNEHLSLYFTELNKLLNQYKLSKSKEIETEIITILRNIIKDKKYQLLLLSDEDLKELKELILNYEDNPKFNNILKIVKPLNEEILEKTKNLNYDKKTDLIKLKKYINKHSKSKNQKYKRILRNYIIKISERTTIDKNSYERFGELVLLIIKNILKKPKFSGYTYRDEFYSDSTDKIFRYMKNFNHNLISKITGQPVNAFSYISQYVHNSILFIINTQKAETEAIQNFINSYNAEISEESNISKYENNTKEYIKEFTKIKSKLITEIKNELDNLHQKNLNEYTDFIFIYPSDYKINLEEYKEIIKLKENIKSTITVKRNSNDK